MNKVLTQDEIDALLRGVQSGEVETEGRDDGDAEVTPYDLAGQERIVRGRMPGLEMANERFARLFRNSISAVIMKFIDVSVHGVETVKFNEFMRGIPLPSSINIFKMEPLKGYSLFVIEAPMVFAFIEFFFGGNFARHVKTEGRYFTPIEQRIVKKVVDMALKDLTEAWTGLAQIRPVYVSSEMNPQFVTIVTPTEVVIKVEIHVEVEDFTGKMYFCIPYSVVEPIKDKLASGLQGDKVAGSGRWEEMIKEAIVNSLIDVTVELGSTSLTVMELLNLQIGNVITLNKYSTEDLIINVEHVPKLRCQPGVIKGAQAVRITGEAAQEE